MVEAAGVELNERSENKQLIRFSTSQKPRKPRQWAFHCTRIARDSEVRVEYTNCDHTWNLTQEDSDKLRAHLEEIAQ